MRDVAKSNQISRRKFVGVLGGGTLFLVTAWKMAPNWLIDEQAESLKYGSGIEGEKVSVWVHIHEDDRITIYNPSSEMGQGSMTALAVIVAEEMDADWSKVTIDQSPADPSIYGAGWGGRGRKSMITVGSRTVASYYESLRQAGAQARYVLLSNVAEKWGVPIGELRTEPNVVLHEGSNKRMTYGQIAAFVKPMDNLPEIPQNQLKHPDDFRLIGKTAPRFDIPPKCNGDAEYAIDVKVPNMVYGVISRSPVYRAKPTLLNEQEVRDISGVVDIIKIDHGIGLVAETLELALKTKPKLQIQWSKGNAADNFTSDEALSSYPGIAADPALKGNVIAEKGNIANALKNGAKTYTSDYLNDFVYHAQMEPLNAVVSVSEDGQSAKVWVGTQAPGNARKAIAEELGIDASKVKFVRTYLGGGFGRRSASDSVIEAVKLAKVVKRPLKLVWTREDDLQYGMFRPMSLQRMQASVDASGKLTAGKHVLVGTGNNLMASGAKTEFYSIPNQHIEVRNLDHGVRTKHWRAVGHGPNKFAIEAFIDEIAADQNRDPYEFRMNLMKEFPRAQHVLKTAVEMAKWKTPSASGRAKGI
ncbi:MAG: molybdopterin cofactor-binding domain-containing protein, partial [Aurantibacter sp.]